MEVELRPLSLGEILDRTAALYRTHFLLFAGIAMMPPAAVLVWKLMELGVVHEFARHHGARMANTYVASSLGLMALVISVALTGIAMAASAYAVSCIQLGSSTDIVASYKNVRQHWFRYLWLIFVAALYSWGPTGILIGALFAAAVMQRIQHIGPGSGNFWLVTLVFVVSGLGLLVTVPLGIWMSMRYAVAVPASIFENLGIHASLRRSALLTRSGRFRIFVMFLLVMVVVYVIAIAAQMPFILLAIKSKGVLTIAEQIGSLLVNFIVSTLIGPVYAIAVTLFYYDQRIRKEGFDIEWMMQRAQLDGVVTELPHPAPPEPSLG